MQNIQPPVVPQEPRAWFFHYAQRLYTALIPKVVRRFMMLLLFQVAPDVPASLTRAWNGASLNKVFTIAASLTFIMCFVVVTVWSAMTGTLTGSDPSRLYFFKDWVNLLNYTVLCPLSVGFGAVLISTTIKGWSELSELTASEGSLGRPTRDGFATFLLLFVVLMVAFLLNVKFMSETLDPAIYQLNYWFIDHVGPDGSRIIGAFGFYYGLLNFCLLLISLFVTVAFISEFRLLFQIAESLDQLNQKRSLSADVLRSRLKTFTQVYLAGKLVVASYMAIALVWKTSQMRHSMNLVFLGGGLTFFGVLFLSIPRYYIELQWFRLRCVTPRSVAPEYEDLRPWEIDFVGGAWKPKIVASLVDTAIIGGFITSFWL